MVQEIVVLVFREVVAEEPENLEEKEFQEYLLETVEMVCILETSLETTLEIRVDLLEVVEDLEELAQI